MTVADSKSGGFTVGSYFHTLSGLLGAPGRFFSDLPDPVGPGRPCGFLLVSSLFFAAASFPCFRQNPFLLSGIFFVNAFCMPMIAAGAAFLITFFAFRNRLRFERLFAIYAYASGVTLLASWIPYSVWVTEPWKWILICLGMVRGGGLMWKQAIVVIVSSVVLLLLVFWLIMPIAGQLKVLTGGG